MPTAMGYAFSNTMSKLREFVEGAANVANFQEHLLSTMRDMFGAEDSGEYTALEASILAPGIDGWESRALTLIKSSVSARFSSLSRECDTLNQKYKKVVAHPNQPEDFWVDPMRQPHLRAYWCLRCGYHVTTMALSGICCHGQPECPRCHHEVHEDKCLRKKPASAS